MYRCQSWVDSVFFAKYVSFDPYGNTRHQCHARLQSPHRCPLPPDRLDTPLDSARILTPNVVRLPEGGYRMSYSGRGPAHPDPNAIGYILSTRSVDADTWIKDPGIRIDLHSPRTTTRTLCPDVVPLPVV